MLRPQSKYLKLEHVELYPALRLLFPAADADFPTVASSLLSPIAPTSQRPLPMKYEMYRQLNTNERKLQWYWRLKPAKGKAVAHSAVGYDAEADCIESIALTKAFATAPVMNITTKKSLEVAPAKTGSAG